MRFLFKLLKYGSVTLVLVVWFPLQFEVVSSLPQLALAVVVTGYLVALLLLALATVSDRFGVKPTARLNGWFAVIAPAALAPLIHFYLMLESYWYEIYYYCDTCGWMQFLSLFVPRRRESPYTLHAFQIVAVAAALYAILLVSSLFIKVMHGRSQRN
ncbi:hypothetical protein SSBR45G_24130 [Bradyrhizobium sp. SSBR45G]|uniref:hypothetical protein n=1 Tax=unclassified Bradyrhizobium TaxID=2631580 RepID=UPI002342A069|nr:MULTISPECIES: hypothetical protein [unclassified Bradyrhizobium]GLH77505.1 hypothetical protein SSBR45G_24130 [Bradyrhizobium sp. SSBR45G]GLH84389.1 hypothetical protein SSBR45R_18490 [Bradyrhizobium sp. SSBR45R]